MKTIGASIAVYKGVEHDFCFEACINSVMGCCDEVCVSYIPSNDGTVELLQEMAKYQPKIKLLEYPDLKPHNDGLWVMTWTNWIRERLSTDYNFQMDADEVLQDGNDERIRQRVNVDREVSLRLTRHNFWQDAKHTLRPNKVCGSEVLRISPKRHWLPADVPLPQGQDAMNLDTAATDIEIMHYGFLRRHEAFFRKEKYLQTAFTGGWDPALENLPVDQRPEWMKLAHKDNPDYYPLVEYRGTHPQCAHKWLQDRGYKI